MFRSSSESRNQARKIVTKKTAIGLPRKEASKLYQFGSKGSSRQAVDDLSIYLEWRKYNGLPVGMESNKSQIEAFLAEGAEVYAQKALNAHRVALAKIYQIEHLSHFKSLKITEEDSRDYFYPELLKIISHQCEKNAISTTIGLTSGLRTHEFCTLRPISEQPPSAHRRWRSDLFVGMPDHAIYTVVGKGGLCRQVAIPSSMVVVLESYRLPSPRIVRDRKIDYEMHYGIGYGQSLSQSFSDASERALGWTTGFHGLRHSYAKRRFAELSKLGYSFELAELIVSQELGHFRPQITSAYFR